MLTPERIREIFLANGFTIKPGETDLKPYVYAAARSLERVALEWAATLIETTCETTTIENAGETQRHLTRRRMKDLTGMTWAKAIRARIEQADT